MDRAVFFDRLRAPLFGGVLTQSQVDGLGVLLDAAARHGVSDARHLAYALATCFHETARTMLPIREHGGAEYFRRIYDIRGQRPAKARELGNLEPGDGARYCGRGYVQITGRTNYERAGRKIGKDLVGAPDLALDPANAAAILYAGMAEGWFTGRKLADYFAAGRDDATEARRIINGTDRAKEIAGYHRSFLAALRAAGWQAGAPSGDKPVDPGLTAPPGDFYVPPPPPPSPDPAAHAAPAGPPPEAAPSFLGSLLRVVVRLFTRP